MQEITDLGVKTYLIYYINSKTAQILHVEAAFTNDIDSWIKESSSKQIEENLCEHLMEGNCDRRIIWEVQKGICIGGIDTSFVKIPNKKALN